MNPPANWGHPPDACWNPYTYFLRYSKHIHIRLTDASKLAVGVNVNMNSCLAFCVGPPAHWQPPQGIPCFLSCDMGQATTYFLSVYKIRLGVTLGFGPLTHSWTLSPEVHAGLFWLLRVTERNERWMPDVSPAHCTHIFLCFTSFTVKLFHCMILPPYMCRCISQVGRNNGH